MRTTKIGIAMRAKRVRQNHFEPFQKSANAMRDLVFDPVLKRTDRRAIDLSSIWMESKAYIRIKIQKRKTPRGNSNENLTQPSNQRFDNRESTRR